MKIGRSVGLLKEAIGTNRFLFPMNGCIWMGKNILIFALKSSLEQFPFQINISNFCQSFKKLRDSHYFCYDLISFFNQLSPYAMGSHNQLPHLQHHSPPLLHTHDSPNARYLWDPSAVAAASNFHHPSTHG